MLHRGSVRRNGRPHRVKRRLRARPGREPIATSALGTASGRDRMLHRGSVRRNGRPHRVKQRLRAHPEREPIATSALGTASGRDRIHHRGSVLRMGDARTIARLHRARPGCAAQQGRKLMHPIVRRQQAQCGPHPVCRLAIRPTRVHGNAALTVGAESRARPERSRRYGPGAAARTRHRLRCTTRGRARHLAGSNSAARTPRPPRGMRCEIPVERPRARATRGGTGRGRRPPQPHQAPAPRHRSRKASAPCAIRVVDLAAAPP